MGELTLNLFEIGSDDEPMTVVEVEESENVDGSTPKDSTFNLLMLDVSGSMDLFWDCLLEYWNKFVSPVLRGRTQIFTFGNAVYFVREQAFLEDKDFKCESTNLTDAIFKIQTILEECRESYIRVILITDGQHNASNTKPEVAIEKLSVPTGKTVEVFLLGIGSDFPVNYSVSMRSLLHNGCKNIPTIFWANMEDVFHNESYEEIVESVLGSEITNIANYLGKHNVQISVTPSGCPAPGFPQSEEFYLGEYICFEKCADDLIPSLKILTKEGTQIQKRFNTMKITADYLMKNIFRQWNALIIQEHHKSKNTCSATFDIMEKIFKRFYNEAEKQLDSMDKNEESSIKYRLAKKKVKFIETEFNTLMNQSKRIIGIEEQFSSEIELAKSILKTTVKSKYDSKILKIKGHANADYKTDMTNFIKIYEDIKEKIMALPEPHPDECCNVTMASLVKDLQDPHLLDLLQEDKFTLMKTLTITGIPVYAPVKDSSQINSWTFCVKKILVSPYSIISQTALEFSADIGNLESSENKEIFLQEGDINSRFNAIIPVVTSTIVEELKPLLTSNIFAMMNTFCILKNPHAVDFDVHLAALGCTWFRTICDSPVNSRSEYISKRLTLIENTAKIYMKRKNILKYIDILHSDPAEALMSESSKEFDDKRIKCESLVKPLFLLHLSLNKFKNMEQLKNLFSFIIMEFIGRCLPSGQNNSNSDKHTFYFTQNSDSTESENNHLEQEIQTRSALLLESFLKDSGKLVECYYKPEELTKALTKFAKSQFNDMNSLFEIKLDISKIQRLRNLGSAGDVTLNDLKSVFLEFKLSQQEVENLFDYEKIFVYVHHCLGHKNSKERLSSELPTFQDAFEKVKSNVLQESGYQLKKAVLKRVLDQASNIWMNDFLERHENEIVRPMSQNEVLNEAISRGVQVDQHSFNKVFRYNRKTGLLRNACMVKRCPFYLSPNRTFNQHISKERKEGFVHQLHQFSLKKAKSTGEAEDVVRSILDEGYESQNGRKVPNVPSAHRLQSVKTGINSLIGEYKQLLKNGEISDT